MAGEDKLKRKVWTVIETKGLLKCYLARKDEFLHLRKKRNAYSHILEDMLAQGLADASTTVLALESKMRTLLSAYKCAKDNAGRTGAAPCIAPYMEEMEEIFGSSILVGNVQTLSLGISRANPLKVLPKPIVDTLPSPSAPLSSSLSPSALVSQSPSPSALLSQSPSPSAILSTSLLSPSPSPSTLLSPSPSPSPIRLIPSTSSSSPSPSPSPSPSVPQTMIDQTAGPSKKKKKLHVKFIMPKKLK